MVTNSDYFSRMLETYEEYNGKTPEQYAAELQAAISVRDIQNRGFYLHM